MDFSQLSDEEIVQLIVQELNSRLFAELVRRHQTRVIQQCFRQLKDREMAHDIAQEVWIRVFIKLGQFRANQPFSHWLSVIVRNRCYDHIQQNKRDLHQELSQNITDRLEADKEIDTENITEPTVEVLAELMEYLSGEEKLLLHMKYKQGWSVKEIQQCMLLSESAIKSRLQRIREKLQGKLNHYRE